MIFTRPEVFILVFSNLSILTILILKFFILQPSKKKKDDYNNNIILSFEEVNTVIDKVVNEVIDNHKLHYRLKEIAIIPDMSKDAMNISQEIIKSFNDNFISQVCNYYTKEYFYALITRKVQIFLIDYTNEHKPSTK